MVAAPAELRRSSLDPAPPEPSRTARARVPPPPGPRAPALRPTILLLLLFNTAPAVPAADLPTAEALHYRWQIEGPSGLLVRLLPFFPVSGDSVISTEAADDPGRFRYQFRSTSADAPAGSHWTYVAEVDRASRNTVRVVDRLRFRDRDKTRTYEIAADRAVDLLNGLFQLRAAEPPDEPQVRTLWSNRRLYPVRIEPRGLVERSVAGQTRRLREFALRGVREPGVRFWKGDVGVWLEPKPPFRPVEILFERSLGRIRLTLREPAGPPATP